MKHLLKEAQGKTAAGVGIYVNTGPDCYQQNVLFLDKCYKAPPVNPMPEPSTLALFATGIVSAASMRIKRFLLG